MGQAEALGCSLKTTTSHFPNDKSRFSTGNHGQINTSHPMFWYQRVFRDSLQTVHIQLHHGGVSSYLVSTVCSKPLRDVSPDQSVPVLNHVRQT